MGYDCIYTLLNTEEEQGRVYDVIEDLTDSKGEYAIEGEMYDEIMKSLLEDKRIRWGAFRDDMKAVSKYVDFTIVIQGQGEDWDDIWRSHFNKGKVIRFERAVIRWGNVETGEIQ